jgi:GTP-binding protein EngB required for normal cell division
MTNKLPIDSLVNTWNSLTGEVMKRLPIDQLTNTLLQWFSVSDSQVAEILEKVRQELPTTEALLIGKPQTGKSSIIRGITGVSAEIVGQGFRPHTQNTQRYTYPAEDLPLLIFTDTVGFRGCLSTHRRGNRRIIGRFSRKQGSAQVFIVTVKIDDFATDSLLEITKQLRQKYPKIPCLLAVTCLHQLYPPHTVDHPPYPPDCEDINRAYQEIKETFKDLYDNSVLIELYPQGIRNGFFFFFL